MSSWLEKWAWGKSSALDVAQQARDWVEDHADLPAGVLDERVRRLASTTTNPQNCERVLESILNFAGMPGPYPIHDSSIELILKPDEMMAWLHRACPTRFRVNCGADPEGVTWFWESLQSSPAGADLWRLHPWLQDRTPAQLRFHLPLVVFDDAGPVSKTSSTYVRVWYSLLGRGSEKETRYLLATGTKSNKKQDRSWGPILDSFESLASATNEPGVWRGILFCWWRPRRGVQCHGFTTLWFHRRVQVIK